MTEPGSDSVYRAHMRSAEQFDYFVLAIISATTAYLVQNATAGRFSSPSYDLYLASISCLLLAMVCGFVRIEKSIVCKQLRAKVIQFTENRAALKQSMNEVDSEILYASTG